MVTVNELTSPHTRDLGAHEPPAEADVCRL
jgi:hypothetical protein